MSHFAKVEDGIVTAVIVAEQEHIDTLEGTWVQTSYNTLGGITNSLTSPALRKNFACIGMVYDSVRDAFYAAQPYDSWTLDEDTCYWEPPVAHPGDGAYNWNEETQTWDAVTP
jgi:hypothetical protein